MSWDLRLCLVVVSVLAATGHTNDELKTHLRGALNLGWTASCPARWRPPPPTSGPPSSAHATNCSAWDTDARTRNWPSGSSAGPIAAAVYGALCGSTPIITAAIYRLPFNAKDRGNRGGHA
ncbi:MAG TPA: hypothetical protein VIX84_23985 [Acidimicrobiales bacterium]